jgi:uncharacterized membrane protein YgdD (TMEM256/DUF423 family)
MKRLWLIGAGLNGFLGIAAGAWAAHADPDRFSETALDWLRTGGFYQLVHGAALLGIAALAIRRAGWLVDFVGGCFFLGPILFSFGLYALALDLSFWPGFVSPLGGALMLLGWLCLIPFGLQRNRDGR